MMAAQLFTKADRSESSRCKISPRRITPHRGIVHVPEAFGSTGTLMRQWTVHPMYLDPQGLVALWREALLARAVLRGETIGYRHHSQVERFRAYSALRSAFNAYLAGVLEEAQSRGFSFNAKKVGPIRGQAELSATAGQISHEWRHLLGKLQARSPEHFLRVRAIAKPQPHPLFRVSPGAVASWERSQRQPSGQLKNMQRSAIWRFP